MSVGGRICAILVFFAYFLSGCASVVTDNSMEGLPVAAFQNAHAVGTVTLVAFRRKDIKTKRHSGYSLDSLDKVFVSGVQEAIQNSGFFSKIRNVSIPNPGISAELPVDQSFNERVQDKLRDLTASTQSDYLLEVYAYALQTKPEPIDLPIWEFLPSAVWGILHIATFGLIPIRSGLSEKMKAELYDGKGALVSRADFSASASRWDWTPFVLRKDAQEGTFSQIPRKKFTTAVTEQLLGRLAFP